MTPTRILVTGSRNWTDRETLEHELADECDSFPGPVIVVHGDCPRGADAIAARFIREWGHKYGGITAEPHPADWDNQGPAAGPIRNQRMVDLGAVLCLAFPLGESRGTYDCVRRANRAGIPVRVVPERRK